MKGEPANTPSPPRASPAVYAPSRERASGGLAEYPISIGTSQLRIRFDPRAFALEASALTAWVERCARAVQAYYGVFPVPALEIRLRSFKGVGVRGGRALPTRPPRIEMSVGQSASPADLARNWSMTHEMVHLAFPNVDDAHLWLEEGLASYVEPIARARVGWLREDEVWTEWLVNMPRGLPRASDAGLDHTRSWGRIYWGGALFCLLADIEIRKATARRYELGDALRAILIGGGNMTARWSIERALRVGDEATGSSVLSDLYGRMKDQPVAIDLQALWSELGVSLESGRIEYTDTAPLAKLRSSFILKR